MPRSLTLQGIVESFADLQSLFPAAEPATQPRILQALFEQVEGPRPDPGLAISSLEAEAPGLAAAMRGEFRVEVRKTGRGERDSPSLTQQTIPFLLINRTPPRDAAEETA